MLQHNRFWTNTAEYSKKYSRK